MSTTAQHSSTGPAPWRQPFLEHISKMPTPQFVLSTLDSAPAGSPTPYVPRARYCIFRGMWAELPENKHNEGPKNPRAYETEMPAFTTDVRMEKVAQLFGTGKGHAESEKQAQGSGGGGPVEAVWWAEEVGVQWRIKGTAFVVADDVEGKGEESSGVRTVKSEVGKRMRVVDEGKVGEWSWEREVTGHFGNMSPPMRGSFSGPPPGRPVDQPYNSEYRKLGTPVEDLNDSVARRNFRVVIIRPDEVEQTDLSDPAKARRWKYTFEESSGKWNVVETWP